MKHKIISENDLAQGSDLWKKARLSAIGGSEIATIMGLNPYETAYQLWQIKTGLKEAPDLSNNYNIIRGHKLEPKARELTEDKLNRKFEPCTFQSEEYSFIRYSSDGYDQEHNELIEIKCPGPKNHQIICDTNAPLDYYVPQCQWALMITDAKCIHFVSYNQEFPEPIHIVTVYPDIDYQKNMLDIAIDFWHKVENKIQPELSDADYEDISSTNFASLVKEYQDAKNLVKIADKHIKEIEEKIKLAAKGKNVIGNGLKVSQVTRKGNVDYSKIPALQDLDLEPYRKDSSQYQLISLIKS